MKRPGITLWTLSFALLYTFYFSLAFFRMNVSAFPMHADGCWYFSIARNIALGRGLVEDSVWHFAIPFTGVTHPIGNY
jgi:hypothetical protein